MSARKYIRIALTEDDQESFERAKEEKENATGVSMSDSMFALSVIRFAIKRRSETG